MSYLPLKIIRSNASCGIFMPIFDISAISAHHEGGI